MVNKVHYVSKPTKESPTYRILCSGSTLSFDDVTFPSYKIKPNCESCIMLHLANPKDTARHSSEVDALFVEFGESLVDKYFEDV